MKNSRSSWISTSSNSTESSSPSHLNANFTTSSKERSLISDSRSRLWSMKKKKDQSYNAKEAL
jgi:hypothetical protein